MTELQTRQFLKPVEDEIEEEYECPKTYTVDTEWPKRAVLEILVEVTDGKVSRDTGYQTAGQNLSADTVPIRTYEIM